MPRVAKVATVVVAPLTVSVTTTFRSGTLPQLTTVPPKVIGWPAHCGEGPQVLVTEMQGAVQIGQLRLAVDLTVWAGKGQVVVSCPGGATSVPEAVTEVLTGPQPFPDAATVTVKFPHAPAANVVGAPLTVPAVGVIVMFAS